MPINLDLVETAADKVIKLKPEHSCNIEGWVVIRKDEDAFFAYPEDEGPEGISAEEFNIDDATDFVADIF